VCSFGDASITEDEVSEAFQMAVLHSLPNIYLVQDNEWDISTHSNEFRAMDAAEYAKGFKGLETRSVNGSDFSECFETFGNVLKIVRKKRRPFLVHAKVPLLAHHTSGVRMEWYRPEEDLQKHESRDPIPILRKMLLKSGIRDTAIKQIEKNANNRVKGDFTQAQKADDPAAESLFENIFAPTPVTEEKGERSPKNGEEIIMVDAALHAIDEIMKKHPESLLYGQDVGGTWGSIS
jgi:2-oxoisovalerate dehydrogenase E1 component